MPWRRPLASLNYLLSSHVWRQDHNGFTHQDPGLPRRRDEQEARDRAGLPAAGREHPAVDLRPLPAVAALRQRRGRRQAAAGRTGSRSSEAALHCARGAGIWEWAGTDDEAGTVPDVVLACAGDVPTLETLAAAADPARNGCPTCGSGWSTWST